MISDIYWNFVLEKFYNRIIHLISLFRLFRATWVYKDLWELLDFPYVYKLFYRLSLETRLKSVKPKRKKEFSLSLSPFVNN